MGGSNTETGLRTENGAAHRARHCQATPCGPISADHRRRPDDGRAVEGRDARQGMELISSMTRASTGTSLASAIGPWQQERRTRITPRRCHQRTRGGAADAGISSKERHGESLAVSSRPEGSRSVCHFFPVSSRRPGLFTAQPARAGPGCYLDRGDGSREMETAWSGGGYAERTRRMGS
jgi:hypothetical protein